MEVLTPEAEDVLVYRRYTGASEVLLAVNVRDTSATVAVPSAYDDASLTEARSGQPVAGDSLSLSPYGVRLLTPTP